MTREGRCQMQRADELTVSHALVSFRDWQRCTLRKGYRSTQKWLW